MIFHLKTTITFLEVVISLNITVDTPVKRFKNILFLSNSEILYLLT